MKPGPGQVIAMVFLGAILATVLALTFLVLIPEIWRF